MLRAIISSFSANLSIHAGVAPTYRRALERCWAGFWAVVGFDGLLTYSSGPVTVACCVGWGTTSCSVPHQHALTHNNRESGSSSVQMGTKQAGASEAGIWEAGSMVSFLGPTAFSCDSEQGSAPIEPLLPA